MAPRQCRLAARSHVVEELTASPGDTHSCQSVVHHQHGRAVARAETLDLDDRERADGSVPPSGISSASVISSVTRSAPLSAHDSVRQTCTTYVRPAGGRTSRSRTRRPRHPPACTRSTRRRAASRWPRCGPAARCTRNSAYRIADFRHSGGYCAARRSNSARRSGVKAKGAPSGGSFRSDCWKPLWYGIFGWKLTGPRLP